MDLQLNGRYFIVCGASSGFGRAITERLVMEGARILAIARREESLKQLQQSNPESISILAGDLTQDGFSDKILEAISGKTLDGILMNSGGPPARSFSETSMADWDEAYHNLVRWKIELLHKLLPGFVRQRYGRIVFIESVSVKQPVENLILSNSLRMAVVGLAKTIANETGSKGITVNVLAPGYHDTPAMDRLFAKRSELKKISVHEARSMFEKELMTGKMGKPEEFALLAAWLLSPVSGYVTGQTFSVDGGIVKFVFG